MVLLSFVLQVVMIGVFRQYRTRPGDDHFAFGWEMGRIARSLALGEGFSNPYGDHTGPSAWEPPIYPYLMGAVFKVFGIYTYESAWVLLTFNSLLSALTCIPIFLIARKTFGEKVAIWSARTWAFLPYIWYWSVHWLWDATLTPLILSLTFLVALDLQEWRGWSGWAIFGALCGVGALANPAMLAFVPFCGFWIWWQRYRRGLPSMGGVVFAAMVFGLVLSPWLIRNYEVFRRFVFIRDDFGLQFRIGNWDGAQGLQMSYLQPNLSNLEFQKFQRMGELAYEADCRKIAFDWIRTHRAKFIEISLKRFFYYWDGVPRPTDSRLAVDFRNSLYLASSILALWGLVRALRQKRPAAWLFAGLIAIYPAVYYFVFTHARYRHPIEPELVIMGVFLLTEIGKGSPASGDLVAAKEADVVGASGASLKAEGI